MLAFCHEIGYTIPIGKFVRTNLLNFKKEYAICSVNKWQENTHGKI